MPSVLFRVVTKLAKKLDYVCVCVCVCVYVPLFTLTYLHYRLFYPEASNAMISSLVWDFAQRRMVVCYRRFGTTCWSHFQVSSSGLLDL